MFIFIVQFLFVSILCGLIGAAPHDDLKNSESVMVSYEVVGAGATAESSGPSGNNPENQILYRIRRSPTYHSGYGLYNGHGLYQKPVYVQPVQVQPIYQTQHYQYQQPQVTHYGTVGTGSTGQTQAQAQAISAQFEGIGGISGAAASASSSSDNQNKLLYGKRK